MAPAKLIDHFGHELDGSAMYREVTCAMSRSVSTIVVRTDLMGNVDDETGISASGTFANDSCLQHGDAKTGIEL